MDAIKNFLIQYGYWGMLIAAFAAGSFFPFSSEAVMIGLMATGLEPITLAIYGTIGNVLGSLLNYGIGRLGKMEWVEYSELSKINTVDDLEELLKVMNSSNLSEFQYVVKNEIWEVSLK